MASIPLSSTEIKLIKGVPFHSDYKHTRWFDTLSSQTAYFNGMENKYQSNQFNVIKQQTGQVRVALHIDQLRDCNYMYFSNKGKRYYCFVEKTDYINDGNTLIHFKIDVLQTYMFDFSFKPSFVSREHQDRNEMNTLNEGLDYGSDYDTVAIEKFTPNDGMQFLVILTKTPIHEGDSDIQPSIIGTPQPLHFYILPYWNSSTMDDLNTPTVSKTLNLDQEFTSPPIGALRSLYSDESSVNNIVSIYITQDPGLFMRTYGRGTETGDILGRLILDDNADQNTSIVDTGELKLIYVNKIRRFAYRSERVVSNYIEKFPTAGDKKLTRSPYSKIIIDDMRGNRIELDPEKIYGSHLNLNVKGGIGHNNIVQYGIENYNYTMGSNFNYENELTNEMAVVNNRPQDVAILNDQLAAYMQGNKNSLNQQKSMQSFGALNSLINTGMGMASGGLVNAANTAVSGAQGMGSTLMSIKSLEAQLKDIETSPPGVSSMGASTHFDAGHNYNGVYIIFKHIKSEYRRKLNDFFKMFGYKQNEVKLPNIKTRQNFNYIQTESCQLNGSINTEHMRELMSVFDNGITVWHTNDVGNYNLSNNERG